MYYNILSRAVFKKTLMTDKFEQWLVATHSLSSTITLLTEHFLFCLSSHHLNYFRNRQEKDLAAYCLSVSVLSDTGDFIIPSFCKFIAWSARHSPFYIFDNAIPDSYMTERRSCSLRRKLACSSSLGNSHHNRMSLTTKSLCIALACFWYFREEHVTSVQPTLVPRVTSPC